MKVLTTSLHKRITTFLLNVLFIFYIFIERELIITNNNFLYISYSEFGKRMIVIVNKEFCY